MKKKIKYNIYAPSDATPILSISSLSFKDTYGNEVKHGSIIIIEKNCNYQHINNKKALIKWNKEFGMFRYILCEDLKKYDKSFGNDFYGIRSFVVCGCASCMDLDGKNIGNTYVCQYCERIVN